VAAECDGRSHGIIKDSGPEASCPASGPGKKVALVWLERYRSKMNRT